MLRRTIFFRFNVQQLRKRHAQSAGNRDQKFQRNIGFPPFNSAIVGRINSGFLCNLLLRVFEPATECEKSRSDPFCSILHIKRLQSLKKDFRRFFLLKYDS